MTQRPALNLVITGRLNLDADRNRLKQLALGQQLLREGLSESELDQKSGAWEKAVSKRYEALGLSAQAPDGSPLSVAEQYDAVAKSVEISNAELLELGEARAVAVKSFLVNEAQLPSERSVIEQTSLDDENNFSGVDLSAGT